MNFSLHAMYYGEILLTTSKLKCLNSGESFRSFFVSAARFLFYLFIVILVSSLIGNKIYASNMLRRLNLLVVNNIQRLRTLGSFLGIS